MNIFYTLGKVLTVAAFFLVACNTSDTSDSKDKKVTVKKDSVQYSSGPVNMNGYVAYNTSDETRKPVILIVHEWWGLNEYTKMRADQLADMGYLAMAVDLYGDGLQADDPEAAGKLALPFYQNPSISKDRLTAALASIKAHPMADTTRIAAIGYCFGGTQVLNLARLGEDLKGVVSFHGNLSGVEVRKELLKADILICHGEADEFVNKEVAPFKKSMDSAAVEYTFKSYPKATHAFTNPNATEKGKKFNMPIEYNEAADKSSWNDMKDFFVKIFGK